MIKEAIVKLSKKEDLTYQEAETVMDEIMSGQATPVQMSSYLTALSIKGETIDEITASAAGMRAHCIKLLHDLDVLEIVGTGGFVLFCNLQIRKIRCDQALGRGCFFYFTDVGHSWFF